MRNLIRECLIEEFRPDLIKECTIAAVRLDNGVVLAKNRDRGYKANVEVIHELIDDVEILIGETLIPIGVKE